MSDVATASRQRGRILPVPFGDDVRAAPPGPAEVLAPGAVA